VIDYNEAVENLRSTLLSYVDCMQKVQLENEELKQRIRKLVSKVYELETILNIYETTKMKRDNRQWIPVTEKLPENGTRVLITFSLLNKEPWIQCAWFGNPSIDFTENKNKPYFYVAAGELKGVTAWMPLPKPYERSKDA